jgi:protein gp37
MIFVNSMSDLFHEDIPWDFIIEVFQVMAATPQHSYQMLTKRPGRTAYFADHIWPEARWNGRYQPMPPATAWPDNVWAGTSVENQKYAPRLTLLAQVPARVRFVSYEPALEAVDLRPWLGLSVGGESASLPPVLSWVIAGGESGPNARPTHPDWFRSIRDQCQAAGVPFFFKQWGQYRPVFDEPLPVKTRVVMVNPSGSIGLYAQSTIDPRYHLMASVGKNAAGALLDGQEWRGMPER